MSDALTLQAGAACLQLDRLGAQPLSWRVGGRELLWQRAAPWPKTSPVLFPIVGHLRDRQARVAGRSYTMGVHGFAASQPFAVVAQAPDALTLRLEDNAATRAQYPFAFRLDLTARLTPDEVSLTLAVTNRGADPMPFAIGLHPGFAWPFATGRPESYSLEFEHPEAGSIPRLSPSGLMTRDRQPVPLEGTRLPLAPRMFEGEALPFLDTHSQRFRFRAPDGSAIAVTVENFPHLALWSRPPGGFLCLEAWTGYSDHEDFTGELAEKASMRRLAPGAVSRHGMGWRYEGREE